MGLEREISLPTDRIIEVIWPHRLYDDDHASASPCPTIDTRDRKYS